MSIIPEILTNDVEDQDSTFLPDLEDKSLDGAYTDSFKKTMKNQAMLGSEGLDEDIKEKLKLLAESSQLDDLRNQIANIDKDAKYLAEQQALVEQLANPELSADFIAKRMVDLGQLQLDPVALEKNAVNAIASPTDPVDIELGGKYYDIQDRLKADAVNRMFWSNKINHFFEKEEAESIADNTLDFFGHLTFREAGSYLNIDGDAMDTLRAAVLKVNNLEGEDKEAAANSIIGEIVNSQIGWVNPFQVGTILQQAVFGSKFEDDTQTLGLIAEAIPAAADVATLGKLASMGVKASLARRATAEFAEPSAITNSAVQVAESSGFPKSAVSSAVNDALSNKPPVLGSGVHPAIISDNVSATLAKVSSDIGTGDRLAAEILKPLEANKIFSSAEDQVGAMLPLRPSGDTASFTPYIDKMLRTQQAALDEAFLHSVGPEFTEELLQRAIHEVELDKPVREFLDMKVDADGHIVAVIGDRNGRRFLEKETAEKYLEELGSEFLKVKEHSGGGYVLSGKWTYEAAGFAKDKLGTYTINNIDNIINNTLLSTARLAEASHHATMEAASKVIKQGITKGLKSINPISTARNRAAFNTISQKYMREKKWATDAEFATDWKKLRGKALTQGQLAAYRSAKQLDELAHSIDNMTIYRTEASKGYSTYDVGNGFSIDVDRINAKPIDSARILDEDGNLNAHVTVFQDVNGARARTLLPGQLTSTVVKEIEKTHSLVRISDKSSDSFFGSLKAPQTKYVYMPHTIKPRQLDSRQLNKVGGGRGGYSSSHFVKIGRVQTYGDGAKARVHDLTIAAADSITQGSKYAEKLTQSFKVLREFQAEKITKQEANRRISSIGLVDGAVSFQTVDDVLSWGLKRKIITELGDDIPVIQAVRDGDSVVMDSNAFSIDLADGVRNAYQGRSFSKHRSKEEMYHVDGRKAEVLDPIEAIVRNLERASSMQGWAPFKARALDFMEKRYGSSLQTVEHPLDYLTVEVLDNTDAALRAEIKNHQTWLRDLLTYKTKYQEGFARKAEDFIDKVFDNIPQLENAGNWLTLSTRNLFLGDKLAKGSRANIRADLIQSVGKNPSERIKAAVFNMKLGLFNPASFVMQFVQSANIVAIAPRHGAMAMGQGLLGRVALNLDDDALKEMAKRVGGKGLGFDDADDFVSYVKGFKKHGFNYMDRSIAYLDGVAGAQTGSSLVENISNRGRIFFNEGERGARLTAYGTARAEWKSGKGGLNPKKLSVDSAEGIKYIQDRTHSLMLGMTKADLQLAFRAREGEGLRNFIPLATQFWSYPFRAVGVMFGKNLTSAEKARLVLGNFAMFGGAGVPLVSALTEWADDKYGDKMTPELSKLMTNGMIDAGLMAAFDVDTAFGRRAGIGQFFHQLASDFYNKEFAKVMTGAGGTTSLGFVDAFRDAFRAHAAYDEGIVKPVAEGALAAFVDQISSLKKTTQTIYAIQTGHIVDGNKRQYFNVSRSEAFLNLMGFPYEKYHEINKYFTSNKARRQFILDATEDFLTIQMELERAYDNKDEEGVAIAEQKLRLMGESHQRSAPAVWPEILASIKKNNSGKSTYMRMFEKAHSNYILGDEKFTPKGAINREIERQSKELDEEL